MEKYSAIHVFIAFIQKEFEMYKEMMQNTNDTNDRIAKRLNKLYEL